MQEVNKLGIRVYRRVSSEYVEDDNDIYSSNSYKERSILSNYFGIRMVKINGKK